jgi:hypothetical protein
MSSIQKFPISEFPTLNCTKLVVNPTTTILKWDPANKHPGVAVLGAIDTAKTISPGGERGIIAKTGSVIGTDAKTWYYDIKKTVRMHVGMAPITQDFTTVVGTAVDQLINVMEGDKVRFTLTTASTLSVRHEKGDGTVLGITVHDMTAVMGQTMYPWVSDISSNTMSVKIMEDFKFEIYVDPNGSVHMNGPKNDIVDFSLDDITAGVSAILTADPAPVVDGITRCDTSSGAFATTLPDNVTAKGKCHTIVLKVAGNDLTVTAAGSDTIEGNATCVLDIQGQHITMCSCGDGLWIIM